MISDYGRCNDNSRTGDATVTVHIVNDARITVKSMGDASMKIEL